MRRHGRRDAKTLTGGSRLFICMHGAIGSSSYQTCNYRVLDRTLLVLFIKDFLLAPEAINSPLFQAKTFSGRQLTPAGILTTSYTFYHRLRPLRSSSTFIRTPCPSIEDRHGQLRHRVSGHIELVSPCRSRQAGKG